MGCGRGVFPAGQRPRRRHTARGGGAAVSRFELPQEFGALAGVVIEADEVWSGCDGARPEYHLPGWFTLLAPPGKPLRRIAPPEPPPGSYLVGGFPAIRAADPHDSEPWAVPDLMERSGRTYWRWEALYDYIRDVFGGPLPLTVDVVRLVPEPRTGPDAPESQ